MRPAGAHGKATALHVAVILVLFGLNFVLPDYHQGVFSRVLVLAVYATGYNILFGYTGLLSLGHAMFFSAGLYGAGLVVYHLDWGVAAGFAAGTAAGVLLALLIGLLALRTTGVAFMIVTMMFAQVFFLGTLYFAEWTGGDDGLVLRQAARRIDLAGMTVDFSDPGTRYVAALALFSIALLSTLAIVRAPFGRVLVAIRENQERVRMLGYDVFRNKLLAVAASGLICAASGAAYALLFGYVGSTFASIHYSILPLLWVLLGGAATTLGPLVGTLILFYLIDLSSDVINEFVPELSISYLGIVGAALIVLVLFFPKGLLGTVREKWVGWLP